MRILIKNDTFLDGVCTGPFRGDVYGRDAQLETAGTGMRFEAKYVADCSGLLVTPSFLLMSIAIRRWRY